MMKRTKSTRVFKYNIITTQKGREPLWTPGETERMLDGIEAGDLSVFADDERVERYINDRYEQLVNDFKIKELELIPMMAAAFELLIKWYPDFREYVAHVKEHMEAGTEYIMPDEWKRMRGA